MKFKDTVIITPDGEESVLVAIGEAANKFNGMMKLNSSATFIAQNLLEDTSTEKLQSCVMNQYDIDSEKAQEAIKTVISMFDKYSLIQHD